MKLTKNEIREQIYAAETELEVHTNWLSANNVPRLFTKKLMEELKPLVAVHDKLVKELKEEKD